jgi:hypothetical protein
MGEYFVLGVAASVIYKWEAKVNGYYLLDQNKGVYGIFEAPLAEISSSVSLCLSIARQ